MTPTKKIREKILSIVQKLTNRRAYSCLRKNDALFSEIQMYTTRSKSTGCSYSDYWELYKFVRHKKPKEILECGTGISTVVMAHAMMENEKEYKVSGRITSMEEVEEWYQMAHDLMPEHLKKYVDFVLSPRIEDYYSIFRGVRYKDVPDRAYEFVFVDGPNHVAPSDSKVTFNFDYIRVVMNSDKPVYAIVDKRVNTCYVFQKVFGLEKVKYSARHHLGFVDPCTKNDLKVIGGGKAFSDSFRLLGNSELHLKMRKSL